jgi:uncharacterized protein (TIGR03437 family)
MTTRISGIALLFCMVSAWPLAAQAPAFDTSGNYMLSGTGAGITYYFRHVYYLIDTEADSNGIVGDVNSAVALYGNITFFTNGTYTVNNAFVSDSSNSVFGDPLSCYLAGTTCAANAGAAVNGAYSISASGFGFLVDPITGDNVYGLVAANGIFSGSSTEAEVSGTYGDLFIGAPVPSPLPTGFNGSFTVVGMLPGDDMSFQINPNGAGSLGTVAINGYQEGSGTGTVSQQSPNVTYSFSNGAAILTFPASATAPFISGQEYLYFSPDGNFFFGGSPTGFDMIVGVATTSSNQNFGTCINGSSCLYYQAGIDQNFSDLGGGYADLDGYYGSLNATSAGNIFAHERLADQIFTGSTYGWTFSDSFTPPVTGAYTDNDQSFQYWVGDGGTVRIGEGIGPYLGLTVAFQAPTFTPTQSVYIQPNAVVNAASYAPFTAGIANGEFIAIFGTNLAPSTCLPCIASNVPYPPMLNGVQVLINGVSPAPLYSVSPGQINAIVPSAYPYSLAPIVVVNNGVSSNVVTVPVNATAPGVYSYPQGGVYAAAVDTANAQIVTPQTPAQPGDIVEVFATGLGAVFPTVPDGAAPPDSPLSPTVATIQADVDGVSANGQYFFAGLAPTLAGLYQINITIPSTTAAGDHLLGISGSDPNTQDVESYSQQLLISVGGGAASALNAPVASVRGRPRRTNAPSIQRKRPCFFGARVGCSK